MSTIVEETEPSENPTHSVPSKQTTFAKTQPDSPIVERISEKLSVLKVKEEKPKVTEKPTRPRKRRSVYKFLNF